jgi:hypothetical protein
MSVRAAALCLVLAILGGPRTSGAEEAPSKALAVALKDGSRLVGTLVSEDEASITLTLASGLVLALPRADIVSVEPLAPAAFADPNDTRLMFAPTGRPLRKGDGYFSDHYVIFPGFAYGVTDHLSVSGGLSVIPGLRLDEQVLYASSALGWRLGKKAAFSIGGLYATGTDSNEAGAILFGVASFGSSDRALTVGMGFAATRNEEYYYDPYGNFTTETQWQFREAPILLLGGTFRVGKRLSLVTESWLFPGEGFALAEQPFGLALRFCGDRMSVDVGIVLVAEVLDEGFPIPWLSFSYHFGPTRAEAKRRTALSFPGRDGGRRARPTNAF